MSQTVDMTLIEFLLERIADDETSAKTLTDVGHRWVQRVWSECDAKRRIVEFLAIDAGHGFYGPAPLSSVDLGDASTTVLRLMALPYSRHPAHDESWRP